MATVDSKDDLIISSYGKTFTFQEAIELMRLADQRPTGSLDFKWVDSATGKPVTIGYTS